MIRALTAVVFILALAGTVAAAPIGYAVDTGSQLWTVDLSTANATLVGNMGVFLEAVAISPSGQLFGTTLSGQLYSINSTTGAATLVGSSGLGNIEGLDFNGGSLLASNFVGTPSIFSLDTTTGAATLVVTATSATGSVRSMTTLDATTMLIRTDFPGPNTLREIDLGTGATTIVGNLGGSIFAAMDFADNGLLYGLDGNGFLYSINPATGATTFIGDTGNQFWLGLAAAASPVPEPASMLAWGLIAGVGAVGYRLRKRKVAATV